jgi:hypothetical protein
MPRDWYSKHGKDQGGEKKPMHERHALERSSTRTMSAPGGS